MPNLDPPQSRPSKTKTATKLVAVLPPPPVPFGSPLTCTPMNQLALVVASSSFDKTTITPCICTCCALDRSHHFNGGKGGPNSAKWNQFCKCAVVVLGPGN